MEPEGDAQVADLYVYLYYSQVLDPHYRAHEQEKPAYLDKVLRFRLPSVQQVDLSKVSLRVGSFVKINTGAGNDIVCSPLLRDDLVISTTGVEGQIKMCLSRPKASCILRVN